MKFLKLIKDVFLNPIMIFIYIVFTAIFLPIYFHSPVNKYTGTIISISSWDGAAKLKTKNKSGKDTIINVSANRHEEFTVSQIITVWTGGDLFDGIASTKPQH